LKFKIGSGDKAESLINNHHDSHHNNHHNIKHSPATPGGERKPLKAALQMSVNRLSMPKKKDSNADLNGDIQLQQPHLTSSIINHQNHHHRASTPQPNRENHNNVNNELNDGVNVSGNGGGGGNNSSSSSSGVTSGSNSGSSSGHSISKKVIICFCLKI
jgi:hypothetical protein